MSTKFVKTQSDWTCPDPKCANVNFARRDACNRCGKSKPIDKVKKIGREIGKSLAEKSKGLFSADDWQCTQCGNVNWARRSTCNICNAPKFGKVEQRTGFGGGYNERENVEYIERDESDSEYDEFGRKKKKFRGNLKDGEEEEENSESLVPSVNVDVDKEIEISEIKKNSFDDLEVEEEEDDENEDLSKYQLDASDKENENSSRASTSTADSETGGGSQDDTSSDGTSTSGSSENESSDSESDASSHDVDEADSHLQNGAQNEESLEGGKRKEPLGGLPSDQNTNKKPKNSTTASDGAPGTPSGDESN